MKMLWHCILYEFRNFACDSAKVCAVRKVTTTPTTNHDGIANEFYLRTKYYYACKRLQILSIIS